MIEKIEFDLNCVMDQLKKLKELRKEPDLSESDIIRIRSYLLSLIIKQKKQDPERVINGALTLLGEKQLSRKGAQMNVFAHEESECMCKQRRESFLELTSKSQSSQLPLRLSLCQI